MKFDKLYKASQGFIKFKSNCCDRHKYATFKLSLDHFLANWYSLEGALTEKSCVDILLG